MKKYFNLTIKIMLFFLFLVLFQIFIADLYFVPTGSMEYTLKRKSYVVASKISYGARLPRTTHEIPFLSKILKRFDPLELWKEVRLVGLTKIKRKDIILARYKDVNVIKRVVGLPRDTIEIENGLVNVNSKNEEISDSYKLGYIAEFDKNEIECLRDRAELAFLGNEMFDITLSGKLYKELKGKKNVFDFMAKKILTEEHIYPELMAEKWNSNNFGPIVVPYKGMEIELTSKNYNLYSELIRDYEGIEIINKNSEYIVNGQKVKSFIFKRNYFFLMGDDRMSSIDSRFLGFFPKNKILYKIVYWF